MQLQTHQTHRLQKMQTLIKPPHPTSFPISDPGTSVLQTATIPTVPATTASSVIQATTSGEAPVTAAESAAKLADSRTCATLATAVITTKWGPAEAALPAALSATTPQPAASAAMVITWVMLSKHSVVLAQTAVQPALTPRTAPLVP